MSILDAHILNTSEVLQIASRASHKDLANAADRGMLGSSLVSKDGNRRYNFFAPLIMEVLMSQVLAGAAWATGQLLAAVVEERARQREQNGALGTFEDFAALAFKVTAERGPKTSSTYSIRPGDCRLFHVHEFDSVLTAGSWINDGCFSIYMIDQKIEEAFERFDTVRKLQG